jgi:hypothetical protein
MPAIVHPDRAIGRDRARIVTEAVRNRGRAGVRLRCQMVDSRRAPAETNIVRE